jgi:MFS transporter, DHA1 family, inner membrane transport protein
MDDPAVPGRTVQVPAVGLARRVMAVAALFLAGFSFVTVEIAPVGLLSTISADLRVSLSAVGLLVTCYGLTVAIASLPLTRLVAAVPRRYLLSGLLVVLVAATALSVAGRSYSALTVGRVATALSQAVFWSVAAPAAAALFSPQVRGRVTSALFAAPALATVLGVPVVTRLGQQAGWRVAFLAVAALGLFALLGVATLVPTTRPEEGHSAVGSAPDPPRFWAIIAATALAVTGVFAAFTYLAPFLTEVSGFSTGAISPLLSVFGVAGVVGVLAGGVLVDRWPRPAVFVPVLVLTLALLALYALGTHQRVALALVALFGFAVAQAPSIFLARVLDVAPGSTDMASAWFSSAYNVGIAAGALIGGLLLPHTGVRSIYLVGAVLTTLALAVLTIAHVPPPPGPADIASGHPRPAGRGLSSPRHSRRALR